MKKICTIVIILVVITGFVQGIEARSILGQNGSDWAEMSVSAKLDWLSGFIAGSVAVCDEFGHLFFVIPRDASDSDLPMFWKELFTNHRELLINYKEKHERLEIYGITVGQIQKGMDKLYQDYRNQKIAIVDAIYVVKMEIQGERPKLIEAQKRYLRMQPIQWADNTNPFLSMLNLPGFPGKRSALSYLDYKNVKQVQELYLKSGIFVDPKIKEPTKPQDYSYTELFCYGIYE